MTDALCDEPEENIFLEAHEESPDIKMETVRRFSVVLRENAQRPSEIGNGAASSFADTTCIGLVDEKRFEDWFKEVIEQVMDDAVAKRRGKDFPHRWIGYNKTDGFARAIGTVDQLSFECE